MTTRKRNPLPDVIGFYHDHLPVDSDDLVLDPKTGELTKMPSMTKQSFKDECDINNIVKRFEQTGILDHLNQKAAQGVFTDLGTLMDYQGALELARRAEASFMELPAELRAQFENQPGQFLDFIAQAQAGDEAKQEQLIKWGIATDKRPPKPATAPSPAPQPEPTPQPESAPAVK